MVTLEDHLPASAIPYVRTLLQNSRVRLKISRKRLSKYGDYRPGINGQPHLVTINRDLNPYSFLITLVHELAHAFAFDRYGYRIRPHGKEWKSTFCKLMEPLLTITVFPADVLLYLQRHMSNPKASTSADPYLLRVLRNYDRQESRLFLEDLPEGSEFSLLNGRLFVKGEKKRKNFLCVALNNKRKYLINPLAEVRPAQVKEE